MPFLIIAASSAPIGRTFDAFFCQANVNGLADTRHRVPVRITRLSEGKLVIEPDGDVRIIISTISENGRTTFHIEPGHQARLAAVRLAHLATAAQLLQQLTRAMPVLEPPGEVVAGLDPLARWLDAERAKVAARSMGTERSYAAGHCA